MNKPNLPLCKLIATGGTIAMKMDPVTGAPIPAVSGEDLAASVPNLAAIARIEVESLFNVGSANMNRARWRTLHHHVEKTLARSDIAGVVVTHGTDTLEETAWFLALTLNSSKPVILTGAQRNYSEPDFDGLKNLCDAVQICASPDAMNKGVMVVMNGEAYAAREVTKTHTSAVDSFKSEAGPLAKVANRQISWHRQPHQIPHLLLGPGLLPSVEIIPTYAGVNPTLLELAIKAGAKGIVIAALGMGNVNDEMSDAIAATLQQGIPVVISTRVPTGGVSPHYGYKGGGQQLQAMGAIMAHDLNPQKARILLMLALHSGMTSSAIKTLFQ